MGCGCVGVGVWACRCVGAGVCGCVGMWVCGLLGCGGASVRVCGCVRGRGGGRGAAGGAKPSGAVLTPCTGSSSSEHPPGLVQCRTRGAGACTSTGGAPHAHGTPVSSPRTPGLVLTTACQSSSRLLREGGCDGNGWCELGTKAPLDLKRSPPPPPITVICVWIRCAVISARASAPTAIMVAQHRRVPGGGTWVRQQVGGWSVARTVAGLMTTIVID